MQGWIWFALLSFTIHCSSPSLCLGSITVPQHGVPAATSITECPDDYTLTGNMCLRAADTPVTLAEAQKHCSKDGGGIVCIHSKEEQMDVTGFLANFVFDHPVTLANGEKLNFWLGLLNIQGKETWIDGEEFSYSNWLPGRTKDASRQECAVISGKPDQLGYWNDRGCSASYNIICSHSPIETTSVPTKTTTSVPTMGEISYSMEHSYSLEYSFAHENELYSLYSYEDEGFPENLPTMGETSYSMEYSFAHETELYSLPMEYSYENEGFPENLPIMWETSYSMEYYSLSMEFSYENEVFPDYPPTSPGCPKDFYHSGSMCLRVFLEPLDYDEAEDSCQALGTHLVGIHSSQDQKDVADFLDAFYRRKPGMLNYFLTGARWYDETDAYEWSDGLPYEFSNWEVTELPSIDDQKGGEKDCVTIDAEGGPENFGDWNRKHCEKSFNYICSDHWNSEEAGYSMEYSYEFSYSSEYMEEYSYEYSYESEEMPTSLGCPPEFFHSGTMCLKVFYTEQDYDQAESSCQAVGTHLLGIHSPEEEIYVQNYLDMFHRRERGKNVVNYFLTGLKWDFDVDEYEWSDGLPFSFQNWQTKGLAPVYDGGKGNKKKGCVVIDATGERYFGSWNRKICEASYRFICYDYFDSEDDLWIKDYSYSTEAEYRMDYSFSFEYSHEYAFDHSYEYSFNSEETAVCRPGFHHSGTMCLKVFLQQKHYNAAEASCQAMGTHLVGIHSPEEQKYVADYLEMFHRTAHVKPIPYFIGLKWEMKKHKYIWSDGIESSFSQWMKSDLPPVHDEGDLKACAIIDPEGGHKNYGDWNRKHCYTPFSYICYEKAIKVNTTSNIYQENEWNGEPFNSFLRGKDINDALQLSVSEHQLKHEAEKLANLGINEMDVSMEASQENHWRKILMYAIPSVLLVAFVSSRPGGRRRRGYSPV